MNERPEKTTVDVLFHDVRAVELRMWFSGLTVTKRGSEFLDGFSSRPAEMIEHGNEVYGLDSSDWKGFVVGGTLRSMEHDGCKLYDSPLFGESRPDLFVGSGPKRVQ